MLTVLGGNSASTGYNLTRSLRTRSSASAYLNRTPASAGNRKTWTFSAWVKRGTLSSTQDIFAEYSGAADTGVFNLRFDSSDRIAINALTFNFLVTTQVFRDPSAWYHIVVAFDTTQATANNRVRLYVNGAEVTAFGTRNNPTLNTDYGVNENQPHYISRNGAAANSYLDGYLTEVNFIDGQALTPSSFGETDTITGVWKPKAYSGTYGTNGFYLPFTDNSALTTSSNVGLGKDFSGNGNYWATNNISITSGVTYDSMTDVPTLTSATAANFAVLNPLDKGAIDVSAANLTFQRTSSTEDWEHSRATIQIPSSGKWYWEMKFNSGTTDGICTGVCPSTFDLASNFSAGSYTNTYAWLTTPLLVSNNTNSSYGSSPTAGDVIMCAFDRDNNAIYLVKMAHGLTLVILQHRLALLQH